MAMAVSGRAVATAHTIFSSSAFVCALALALSLHYTKVVRNQWYGYPKEWWPSVSAVIGDHFPERNLFQLLIALTAGPRFVLIACLWVNWRQKRRHHNSTFPNVVTAVGVVRSLAAGGWMYITSSDHSMSHDVLMISYIVLTLPWMIGCTYLATTRNQERVNSRKRRKYIGTAFFATIVPLIYLYIQHKKHRIPGAYSRYAYFEWLLIALDIAFDHQSATELGHLKFHLQDTSMSRKPSGPAVNKGEETMQASPPSTISQMRGWLADIYLALIFWTLFTQTPMMIFWFSVWSMGLGGSELLLFANLAPCMLGISFVRLRAIRSTALLHTLSLTGIGAYLWHESWLRYDYEDAYIRLCIVTFGLACSFLAFAATWVRHFHDTQQTYRHAATFMSGLLLSNILKYVNNSENPLWVTTDIRYWRFKNTPAFILAILAVTEVWLRPQRLRLAAAPKPNSSWSLTSLQLGAVFFLLHLFLTDSGTAIRWSWSGYPSRGPFPEHGALSHAAIAMGILASLGGVSSKTSSVSVFSLPVCLAVLYTSTGWASFIASLALHAQLPLLFAASLRQALLHPSGRTFFFALLTYNVLVLLNIFTTAYAFVPHGHVVRERTDIVLGLASGLPALANLTGFLKPSTHFSQARDDTLEESRARPIFNRFMARTLLCLLGLSCIRFGLTKTTTVNLMPFNPQEKILTAGIWTIHFGLENELRDSTHRLRQTIEDMQVDVLGLLESDTQHIATGNRDITLQIAADLGYYVDYGPSPSKHTWGAALLSKFPILNSTHHLLPSPEGELAPAIHATLSVYGTEVDVVVVHNGQEETPLDRQLQSQELGKMMRARFPTPTVFLGYVVTKPQAPKPAPYYYLVEDGLMLDIEIQDADRWCQYILFRGLHRIGYARLSRGKLPSLTDTELQVGRFVVPTLPIDPTVDSARYQQMLESNVLPTRRFPEFFKGRGRRGHQYHALPSNQPMYYPVNAR